MTPTPENVGRRSALSRARRLVRRDASDDPGPAPADGASAASPPIGAPVESRAPAASVPSPAASVPSPAAAVPSPAPTKRSSSTSAQTRPAPSAGRPQSRATATKTSVASLRADSPRSSVVFRPVTSGGDSRPYDDPSDTAVAEPKTSRAGRNLPVAIGVGLGLAGLVFASLFAYRPSFAYVVGAAVLYATYEISRAFRTAGVRICLGPLLVGGAAMLVSAWMRGPSGLVLAALVTVAGVLIWRIADGVHGYTRDVAASVLTLLYVPLLGGFAVLLAHPHDGAGRVIAFIATVVCSDTGGYAAGVAFGKHPLAPVVSKAKTWEGFVGSVLACSAAGILFMMFMFHHAWWKGLLFGLAVVVTATLGDLGESMIKRDLGIKDMGRLLPGHGGIMDRLDSLLPCAAVAYLILTGFVPT